ncbi:hypothetical protein HHX48_06260 [Salinimonas sp. HHU 13199]|uniref:Flagellar hook-length control protein-like C-terminal domain-containing protein n=1 Tax=Salinimonas profundi TaxID=2729140 RepID=A0ABR8LJB2_9ALTE|nr:flagellar hook-length control protein FliK [Salinimonas profundi]MBD3585328.1 hypothetical protein [Salinimonas profundi]
MMQDIATKRQDVAALPINLDGDVDLKPESTNGAAFSQAFRQSSQSAGADKASERNMPSTESSGVSAKKTDARQKTTDKSTGSDNAIQAKDKQSQSGENNVTSGDAAPAVKDKEKAGTVGAKDSKSDTVEGELSETIIAHEGTPEDIDWLAYVDQIRSISDADKNKAVEAEAAITGQTLSADPELQNPAMVDEATKIAHLLNLQGDSTGREQDKIPAIPDLIARLGHEIAAQQKNTNTDAGSTVSDASATLKELAAAIVSGLQNEGAEQQLGEDGQSLEALVAKLKGSSQSDAAQQDAALLLSVIQGQIAGKQTAADEVTQAGAAESVQAISPKMLSLMENIVSLTDKQSEDLAQNITARVADLVPSVSDSAKKQITDAIVAGLSEMKTQIQQGHEPGISLKAMVTEALQQSEVNVTPALSQNIDQQLSQINTLLNAASTTSLAAQQAAQLAAPDMAITENTQVRAESGTATRQAEGLSQPVNIHQPDGQKQLTEKIRWMVNSRNMMAEIRLDPPEMGSMQVRVNVQGDAASVSFIVQSPQAREALAQAEPRLKDMLAQQGIELGESSVQQQSQGQSDTQSDGRGGFGGQTAGHGDADDGTQVIEQPLTRQAQGGIDDYA